MTFSNLERGGTPDRTQLILLIGSVTVFFLSGNPVLLFLLVGIYVAPGREIQDTYLFWRFHFRQVICGGHLLKRFVISRLF